MLLFLILLFFGSRLTPYLCLLKWCFCFNLFFTLILLSSLLFLGAFQSRRLRRHFLFPFYLPVKPVLSFHHTCDHHGSNGIAACVQAGRCRIHQETDGCNQWKCFCRKAKKADYQHFPDQSASRRARQYKCAEHCNRHGHGIGPHAGKGLVKDTEQEADFNNCR